MKGELPEELEDRIKAMEAATYAVHLGIETVSIGEGEASVRMGTGGKTNALGTVHGGAIFSLADQAFALAANSYAEPTVALTASISYLRPAKGDLVATARRVGENKSTSVYEVLVTQEDEVIAIFQGVGYKLRRAAKK